MLRLVADRRSNARKRQTRAAEAAPRVSLSLTIRLNIDFSAIDEGDVSFVSHVDESTRDPDVFLVCEELESIQRVPLRQSAKAALACARARWPAHRAKAENSERP